MKQFSSEQIRELDTYTIAHEPIKSIELMERASRACLNRIVKLVDPNEKITLVCGKGNNGGDGLAISRLLLELGYNCSVFIIHHNETFSPDALVNFKRLQQDFPNCYVEVRTSGDFKSQINRDSILIDAILGTGVNKPIEGFLAEVVQHINSTFQKIISIDVPSGLYCDKSSKENNAIICSNLTLTFQTPKAAFLFAENKTFVPEFEILNIGLLEKGMDTIDTNYYYVTSVDVAALIKPRSKFSHKGTFGHALLLAGSKGKSGAALIASRACLRSGAGLLSVHSTKDTLNGLLTYLPEAMSLEDSHSEHISEIDHPEKYDAIGIGPGCGTHDDSQNVLKKILNYYDGRLIIDADGLNMLSENKTWLSFLNPGTILTPHPKEFERLTESYENDFEQLKGAKHFSMKYKCILILKGAHTVIAMPDGNVFFNSSGNSGLAKGGSGDALTGIILGLLARGYSPPQSALIGTLVHGLAADLCTLKNSKESLLVSDVIEMLPKAFKKLENISKKM